MAGRRYDIPRAEDVDEEEFDFGDGPKKGKKKPTISTAPTSSASSPAAASSSLPKLKITKKRAHEDNGAGDGGGAAAAASSGGEVKKPRLTTTGVAGGGGIKKLSLVSSPPANSAGGGDQKKDGPKPLNFKKLVLTKSKVGGDSPIIAPSPPHLSTTTKTTTSRSTTAPALRLKVHTDKTGAAVGRPPVAPPLSQVSAQEGPAAVLPKLSIGTNGASSVGGAAAAVNGEGKRGAVELKAATTITTAGNKPRIKVEKAEGCSAASEEGKAGEAVAMEIDEMAVTKAGGDDQSVASVAAMIDSAAPIEGGGGGQVTSPKKAVAATEGERGGGVHDEAPVVPAPETPKHEKGTSLKKQKLTPSKEVVKGPPVGNVAGRMEIKRGLKRKDGDPREFIREFQAKNGLETVPEASPALQMLDMLGVPRVQVYHNLFIDLRVKLEERIERCSNEQQLEKLLSSCFGYFTVPEFRPIPERIVNKLRKVPSRFLDKLVGKPQILSELPMKVKQQAWEAHPSLFSTAIADLVTQYTSNRKAVIIPAVDWNVESNNKGFSTQKRRDDNAALTELVACVNRDGPKLESLAYRYITEQYVKEGNPALCTLLSDLIILYAQAQSGRATIIPRLTHLARNLDEWVREGSVEVKALVQVQMNLRSIIGACDASSTRPKAKTHHRSSSGASSVGGGGGSGYGGGGGGGKIPSLDKALVDSMNFLAKQDVDKKWFAKPVWELWPNDVHKETYLKAVLNPMDLGTMRKKLKAGSYTTFEALDHDAQLVYDNCMAFNAPGTTFYNGADKYKKAWLKFKMKYKDVDSHHREKLAAAAAGGPNQKGGSSSSKSKGSGAGGGGGGSNSGGGGPDEVKDPNAPQPLAGRENNIDGEEFGQALVLLADPFVIQVLLRTLMRKVDEVYKAQGLPKDNPIIPSLVQILAMGLDARKQIGRVLNYHHSSSHKPPPPSGSAHNEPSPPEPIPAYSIPKATLTALPAGKDGDPAAENEVQEAIRNVLPCCLELSAYVTLASKYEVAGWEGQPHDKDVIQEKTLEAVGRLYRFVKVWQPSPLLLRIMQYVLIESTAAVDDHRTLPLAKTLVALYDHCHRKKRADPSMNPDPNERFLWTGMASAAIQRASSKMPLKNDLRDLLLSLFIKQLPYVPPPITTSWLHRQLLRLIAVWVTKNLLKHTDLIQHMKEVTEATGGVLLTYLSTYLPMQVGKNVLKDTDLVNHMKEVIEAVGGVQEVWEEEKFNEIRRYYERIDKAEAGVKEVVLGWQIAEGGKEEGEEEGAMEVTGQEERKVNGTSDAGDGSGEGNSIGGERGPKRAR